MCHIGYSNQMQPVHSNWPTFRVVVHLGSSILDMDEGLAVMFSEPVGWQVRSLLISLIYIS